MDGARADLKDAAHTSLGAEVIGCISWGARAPLLPCKSGNHHPSRSADHPGIAKASSVVCAGRKSPKNPIFRSASPNL